MTRIDRDSIGRGGAVGLMQPWTGSVAAAALVLLAGSGTLGQETSSAREWIAKGSEAYKAGDYAGAADAYTKAREMVPDQPEITYNLGAAHYQLGNLDKARELFTESLQRAGRSLEGQAKFNLGNVAYSKALKKLQESEQAANLLKQARNHYRDAIEVDPADQDARANIELAEQLLKQLLQQQKQQQQQQSSDQNQDENQGERQQDQQQEQQKSQPQPQSQPSSQPNPDQSPPQDQENSGEESKPEKPQPSNEDPKEGDSQQASPKEQDQMDQNSQQEASGDKEEEMEKEDDGDAQPSPDKLSREEAERLLQSVRDRERQRREELAKRRQQNRLKVTKDW